jgi:hypothetical protein
MIAMIHVIKWWPTGLIRFAKGSEVFLEHPDLKWSAVFTEETIDHLSQVHGFKSESAV